MPKTREGYGAHKLSKWQVSEIRRLYDYEQYDQLKLAHMFGVSRRMIYLIVNNKSHKHNKNIGTQGSADVHFTIKAESCLSEIKTDRHIDSKDQIH